jgi:ribose 5-phosphate isomerase A
VTAEQEKRLAAEVAALLVEDGMRVGLGTGTTVSYLLPPLAARKLSIRCVATSKRTASAAAALGLAVEPFTTLDELDLAIDGADQIAPDGWLVKGGGGAHAREKIVAAAADRFVVIADSTKPTPKLHPPIPLELAEFGLRATLRRVGHVTLRDALPSPDAGIIADYHAHFDDPAELAARLSSTPGVIAHGLFSPTLVSVILVGRGTEVEKWTLR